MKLRGSDPWRFSLGCMCRIQVGVNTSWSRPKYQMPATLWCQQLSACGRLLSFEVGKGDRKRRINTTHPSKMSWTSWIRDILQGERQITYHEPECPNRSSSNSATFWRASFLSSWTIFSSASRRCASWASSESKSKSFMECVMESRVFAART